MTLDLAQLPKEAVVVIADQPLRWTIAGVGSAWGRIGFEGLAPFDVVNGRPDLLAGFRIAAFGARETARRDRSVPCRPARPAALCATSVRLWTEHFGVAAAR